MQDWFFSGFGLAATVLFCGVVFAIWRKRAGALDPGVSMPELQRFDWPALVTTLGGDVLGSSNAIEVPAHAGRLRIDAVLERFAEITGPQVYRISRLCARAGLALERFRGTSKDLHVAVVAQIYGADRILWQVVPSEHVASLFPDLSEGADLEQPFAQAVFEDGRLVSANARLRSEFAADAPTVLAGLIGAEPFASGQVTLTGADGDAIGATYVCQVREQAGSRRAEIYLFPSAEGSAAATAAAEMLESLPVSLVSLDLDGRAIWGNAQAREMIGQAYANGASLEDMIEPLGRSVAALIAEAKRSDRDGGAEMVRFRSDRADRFAQVVLTRIEVQGDTQLLAVLTDASELRQLEDKFAQSQKMEAIGKLAGGVAHDFNNVLTAISGHCDLLLLRKDASHPDFSDLTQIRQNANRAAALVKQLLAFSRKQTLQPTLLSLQDVVSDTLYLLDRLIGETITLSLDHDSDIGSVRADHQQLEQALMNLVVNARDAMQDGGTVTIATRNRLLQQEIVPGGISIPPGDYVEISVADTGTGIDESVIGNVFDPFFTTKPKGEGTGLGLSTVYGIVKQSGGYIYAENVPGAGARFVIFLPRAYPNERELALQARSEEAPAGEDLTGQGAVLLVEDEAPVRSFASRALRLRGYRVVEADCAEAAMELLESNDDAIDVLVSDVVMPGMDGPTFAAKARELRPGLRVIFVSGYAEDNFRRNLADDDFLFLPKPFSLNDLTAKVKQAVASGSVELQH